jgi:hypothetical protein
VANEGARTEKEEGIHGWRELVLVLVVGATTNLAVEANGILLALEGKVPCLDMVEPLWVFVARLFRNLGEGYCHISCQIMDFFDFPRLFHD